MRLVPGAELSAADRRLADRLTSKLEVAERRDGLQVESKGWVGVVRFQAATVRVEPRLVDGARNLVRMLDFARGLDLVRRLPPPASFDHDGDDLFELMAWLLADACDNVMKLGVIADYRVERDELTVLRGRLDVKAQVLRRWGQVDRLVCDFEERSSEIPENRWLLRALRVARRAVRSPASAAVVRRASRSWEDLCTDDPTEPLHRPIIGRNNHHYRDALELAYLVVDGVSIGELVRGGRVSAFSFMLNMPRLFEDCVATGIAQLLAGSESSVQRQAVNRSILWDPIDRIPFGSLRPDVLIAGRAGTYRLPVDSKYKAYDRESIGISDVYQTAIYALALSGGDGGRRCVIVYPTTLEGRRSHAVHVRVDSAVLAEVEAVGVHMPRWLVELRQRRIGQESQALLDALRWSDRSATASTKRLATVEASTW